MRNETIRLLREQSMPRREIRTILTTGDRRLIHRVLELHRERLEERLSDDVRALSSLERSLLGSDQIGVR